MSTRSIVGVYTDNNQGEWEGRYVHSDGYPSGVGKHLFEEYQRVFKERGLGGMVEYLLSEKVGWSVLMNCDFSLRPAWWEDAYEPSKWKSYDEWLAWITALPPQPPRAYSCREGEMYDLDDPKLGNFFRRSDDSAAYSPHWAYIFDLDHKAMDIFYKYDDWQILATIDMETDQAPDWKAIETIRDQKELGGV